MKTVIKLTSSLFSLAILVGAATFSAPTTAHARESGSFGTRGGGSISVMDVKTAGLSVLYGLKKQGIAEVAGVSIEEITKTLSTAKVTISDHLPPVVRHLTRVYGHTASRENNEIGLDPWYWQMWEPGERRQQVLHLTLQLMDLDDDDQTRSTAIVEAAYPKVFPSESLERERWYRLHRCYPVDKAPVVSWMHQESFMWFDLEQTYGKQVGNCPELLLSDLPDGILQDSRINQLAGAVPILNWSRSTQLIAPLMENLRQADSSNTTIMSGELLDSIKPQDPAVHRELLDIGLRHSDHYARNAALGVLASVGSVDREIQLTLARALSNPAYDRDMMGEIAGVLGAMHPQDPEIALALVRAIPEQGNLEDFFTPTILGALGAIKPRDPAVLAELEKKIAPMGLKIDWLNERK